MDGIKTGRLSRAADHRAPARPHHRQYSRSRRSWNCVSGNVIVDVNEEIRRRTSVTCRKAASRTCTSFGAEHGHSRGVCAKCYSHDLWTRTAGVARPGGRRHRGAVHRRARHAADDADVPYRRHASRVSTSRRLDAAARRHVILPGPCRSSRCKGLGDRHAPDAKGELVVMNRTGSSGSCRTRRGPRPRALPDGLRRAPQGARRRAVDRGRFWSSAILAPSRSSPRMRG